MNARILLVEDEVGVVLVVSDLLRSEGHAVESAPDGPSGLARALAEPFDLLILDVMLPGERAAWKSAGRCAKAVSAAAPRRVPSPSPRGPPPPSSRLRAHPSPNTAVPLNFHRDGVAAELILPLPELEIGFGQPLAATPTEVVPRHGPAQREYVFAHVWMQPPAGAPRRRFTLDYDVIAHEVNNHRAFVFIRNDWNNARLAAAT